VSGRQGPVDSVRRRRLVTSSAAVDERRYQSALGHAAVRLVATDEVAPVLADVIVRQIEPATEAPPALLPRRMAKCSAPYSAERASRNTPMILLCGVCVRERGWVGVGVPACKQRVCNTQSNIVFNQSVSHKFIPGTNCQ